MTREGSYREAMSALKRFRKAVAPGTGDREVYGPGKVDEVADRDKDGHAAIPAPHRHAQQFIIVGDRGGLPAPGRWFGGGTRKDAPGDSNARDPEEKAEVTCEAEPARVSNPMAIKETCVGHL